MRDKIKIDMVLILTFFLLFFFSPLTGWAYFDPGFGGYFVNSVISWFVAGFAFVFAAVIYFFRTIIGQRLFPSGKNTKRYLPSFFCIFLTLAVPLWERSFTGYSQNQ